MRPLWLTLMTIAVRPSPSTGDCHELPATTTVPSTFTVAVLNADRDQHRDVASGCVRQNLGGGESRSCVLPAVLPAYAFAIVVSTMYMEVH